MLLLAVQLTPLSHCGVKPSDPIPPPPASAPKINIATGSTGPHITTPRPAVQTEKSLAEAQPPHRQPIDTIRTEGRGLAQRGSLVWQLCGCFFGSSYFSFRRPEDWRSTFLCSADRTFTTVQHRPPTTALSAQLSWEPEHLFVVMYSTQWRCASVSKQLTNQPVSQSHSGGGSHTLLHRLLAQFLLQLAAVRWRWVVAVGAEMLMMVMVMVMVMVCGCGAWWWGLTSSRRNHWISGRCCVWRRQVFIETEPAECSARKRRRESRQTACQSQISVMNKIISIIIEQSVSWTLNTTPLFYLTIVFRHFLLLQRGSCGRSVSYVNTIKGPKVSGIGQLSGKYFPCVSDKFWYRTDWKPNV